MDTAIRNGDLARTSGNLPYAISGRAEMLQQAEILLGMHRGAFVYAPTMGTLLHTLQGREEELPLAIRYAAQALERHPQLTVTHLHWTEDGLAVTVSGRWGSGVITLKKEE